MKHFAVAPAVLVCLDLQRHRSGVPHAAAIAARCARILAAARQARWPVLHVHSRPGEGDARPLSLLEPRPSEPVFLRGGPSAFSCPGFTEAAHRLGGPLALIGFSLQDAVTATALAALDRRIPVDVVAEAVAVGPGLPPAARPTLESLLASHAPALRLTGLEDLLQAGGAPAVAANHA